jgi:hypothetical protein
MLKMDMSIFFPSPIFCYNLLFISTIYFNLQSSGYAMYFLGTLRPTSYVPKICLLLFF